MKKKTGKDISCRSCAKFPEISGGYNNCKYTPSEWRDGKCFRPKGTAWIKDERQEFMKKQQTQDEWTTEIESFLDKFITCDDALIFFKDRASLEIAYEKEAQANKEYGLVFIHHARFMTLCKMWTTTIDRVKRYHERDSIKSIEVVI